MRTVPGGIAALVSVMVVLAAALAGCGGSSDTETIAAATAVPTEPASQRSVDPAGGGSVDDEPKTLDDYLGVAAGVVRGGQGTGRAGAGFVGGGVDEQVLEEQRLIEQQIQLCMQGQGFTYVPAEIDGGLTLFASSQAEGVSTAEYAETEGFGIATRFDAILEADIDLSEEADPNAEHLATLSEAEAVAWQLALNGAPPERNEEGQLIDPETGDVLTGGPGRATGGCRRDAQINVRGDFSALADLADEFEALDERIAADPRIAEIRRDWAACMLEAGFDYESEDDARVDIQQQLRPLLFSFFDRDQGAAAQPGAGPGNRLQRLVGLELMPEQEAELDALQDLERAVAVASYECTGDADAEVADITARYEAEFVEANREVLESITN